MKSLMSGELGQRGWRMLVLESPKGGNSPLRGLKGINEYSLNYQGPKLLEAFRMHKSVFRIQLHKVRVYSEYHSCNQELQLLCFQIFHSIPYIITVNTICCYSFCRVNVLSFSHVFKYPCSEGQGTTATTKTAYHACFSAGSDPTSQHT